MCSPDELTLLLKAGAALKDLGQTPEEVGQNLAARGYPANESGLEHYLEKELNVFLSMMRAYYMGKVYFGFTGHKRPSGTALRIDKLPEPVQDFLSKQH